MTPYDSATPDNAFLCPPCQRSNIHRHLDFLNDREGFLRLVQVEIVEKRQHPLLVFRELADCKNVSVDGKEQCMCRVGRP